jgi:aubergine-like protein
VNEHEGGLMLMCDISHKIFRTETVVDVMKELKRKAGSAFRIELEKTLIGSIVFTSYNANTYKVDEIVRHFKDFWVFG